MRRDPYLPVVLMLASLLVLQPTSSIAGDPDAKKEEMESAFLQLSLFNPIQLVNERKSISGLRLNLVYAKNADISGVDLGLGLNNVSGNVTGIQIAGVWNGADGTVKGIQIVGLGNNAGSLSGVQIAGFGNEVSRDTTGVQLGLVMNLVLGEMNGIQVSAFNNVSTIFGGSGGAKLSVTGVQIGLANLARGLSGVQIGLFNASEDSTHGVQFGLFNWAHKVRGVQIGVYNSCKSLEGVQLGLINYAEESSIPYLPILRASF